MSKKSLSDKNLIGAAGEHLVLSRLLQRGLLASPAPRGTRKADILVNPLDGGRPVLIQVKTRSWSGARKAWQMGAKHEEIADKDLFYCFVDMGKIHPDVYVVPSKLVAKIVKDTHTKWLETPGKKGQQHNDNNLRIISDPPRIPLKINPPGWLDAYLENWDQIEN